MRLLGLLAVCSLLAVPLLARADSADKELQSVKGDVSYQHGAAPKPLALNASIVLADKDYALTGKESRAAVTLPDSSVVTVGSDTKIQLAFFNQATITTAKFVLYNGTTRFAVRHPAGAKANYTFTTPGASIAVRGTQGDIGVADDSLQVNVYEVCDPSLPVVVTTKSGQKFIVKQGQAFVAKIVNGIIQGQIEGLTSQLVAQFDSEMGGLPMNAAEVKGLAESTVENATGIPGVGSAINNIFGHKKATPTPAPTPASTCS